MREDSLLQNPPSFARSALKFISTSLKESLGYPSSLADLIRTHPEIAVDLPTPSPSIALDDVVAWHKLGTPNVPNLTSREQGVLLGWAEDGAGYRSLLIDREEYRRLICKDVTKAWACDISELHGFSLSKSRLEKFASTDEMVEADSQDLIPEVSLEGMHRNLAHRGIQILHRTDTPDHFVRHSWDGRLFLENGDGSHHLAAAKYIAARIGERVQLKADLHRYSFNGAAVDSLRRDFEMFVILDTPDVACGFLNAMQSFRATWFWHGMPRPYQHTRAILLPRSQSRSMRVASTLRKAGVLDFGDQLSRLAIC